MKKLMLLLAVIIATVMVVNHWNHKQSIANAPMPSAPVVDNGVVQMQSVSDTQTAIVGANPVPAIQQQSFARPSNDTNEVARLVAERSVKADAILRAYNQAVSANAVQMVKPASPSASVVGK